ncbi:cell division protein SepF [Candidatus Synechococcus calcipolaris]|uniref:cell division protein SepF n=1 Tax=Candidatus Synechococcus calcipolaris TaxID=1522304 RepID=UPI003BAD0E87
MMGFTPEQSESDYEYYSHQEGDTSSYSSFNTSTIEQDGNTGPQTGAYTHGETSSSAYTGPSGSTSFAPESAPSGNVIGMPNAGRWWGAVAEVIVMQPRSFDEMPNVIQSLKERKSVVLNLTLMDAEQAQRSVDFVAGATFTIDGHQERIGESIFLFTPNCVQVSTQVGGAHEIPHPPIAAVPSPAPTWGMDPAQRLAQ